jgi:hypothetical protein
VRVTVDLPDDLAAEVERRTPDLTWSQLIVAALVFALAEADAEQPDAHQPNHLGGDAA